MPISVHSPGQGTLLQSMELADSSGIWIFEPRDVKPLIYTITITKWRCNPGWSEPPFSHPLLKFEWVNRGGNHCVQIFWQCYRSASGSHPVFESLCPLINSQEKIYNPIPYDQDRRKTYLEKNGRMQLRGSHLRDLANSSMNCITMHWCDTWFIRSNFCSYQTTRNGREGKNWTEWSSLCASSVIRSKDAISSFMS